MALLKYGAVAVASAVFGATALHLYRGPSNFAEITVVNDSGTPLSVVELTEQRWGNRYRAENLPHRSSVTFPVFAWGEVGYQLRAKPQSGAELRKEFYAEAGYRVTHSVSATQIGHEFAAY